jgi:hypothetical protein
LTDCELSRHNRHDFCSDLQIDPEKRRCNRSNSASPADRTLPFRYCRLGGVDEQEKLRELENAIARLFTRAMKT